MQRGNVTAASQQLCSDYDVQVYTTISPPFASRGDPSRSARTLARGSRARDTRRLTLAGELKYHNGNELWAALLIARWPNVKKYDACSDVARQRLRSASKRPLEKDRHVTSGANVLPEGRQDPGSQ
ncbi:hypothetical protein SRHO_G00198080 [Serrasalmus rhombeus]